MEGRSGGGSRASQSPLTKELRKRVCTPEELPEDLLRAAEGEGEARPTTASFRPRWASSWRGGRMRRGLRAYACPGQGTPPKAQPEAPREHPLQESALPLTSLAHFCPTVPPTCSSQPFPAIAVIDLSLMLWKERPDHVSLPLGCWPPLLG